VFLPVPVKSCNTVPVTSSYTCAVMLGVWRRDGMPSWSAWCDMELRRRATWPQHTVQSEM